MAKAILEKITLWCCVHYGGLGVPHQQGRRESTPVHQHYSAHTHNTPSVCVWGGEDGCHSEWGGGYVVTVTVSGVVGVGVCGERHSE